MGDDSGHDAVDVLRRRIAVLQALERGPAELRALPERVDASRSTVTRALRELEAADWVYRTPDGYARTLAGDLATETYADATGALATLDAIGPALDGLPADADVPAVLLNAATDVFRTPSTPPQELRARLRTYVDDATAVRGALPAIPDDRLLASLADVHPDAGAVRLVVPASVAAQRGLSGLASVAEHDAVALHLTEDPERVGFLAATFPEREGASVLATVHGPDGALRCVLESTAPAAVAWALDEAAAREAASELLGGTATAALPPVLRRDAREIPGDDVSPETRSLPDDLASQGFVALSPAYFADREPSPPGTVLRTGASLTDVAAGRTLDREIPGDDRTRLASALADAAADGGRVALLGPAGSGKTTACKRVAVDWDEADRGPVYYRASGAGAPFTATDELLAVLDDAPGEPLVVVADATREEAAAVFDCVPDAEDAAFLVDAREDEWFDPPAGPGPHRGGVRHDVFETHRVPDLDERERDRFYEHVAAHAEGPVPPRGDLTDRLPAGDDDAHGELLSLLHALARYVADGAATSGQTTLTETVRNLHDELADRPSPGARTVGVHVAALVAAGVRPTKGLVYALAAWPAGPDAESVADALDVLSGAMVVPDGDAYQPVHETWAVQYLDAARSRDGDARTRDRFGAAVGALADLADSPERRRAVAALCPGNAPDVSAIDDDPERWASRLVERVFRVGREWPRLATLYGASDDPPFALPDACPRRDRLRAVQWRGEMAIAAGEMERAVTEFEHLADRAEDADEPWFLARSRERRGYAHERLGEFDRARTLAERALRDYECLDDTQGRAEALNGLGVIAWLQGDVDAASERFEAAIDAYAAAGDLKGQADCHNNRGIVARERGDLDAAERFWERSHTIRTDIGDRHNVIDSLINLGVARRERSDYEAALRRFRHALDRAREVGGREYEAHARRALANTLVERGDDADLADARDHLERALELNEDAGIRFAVGHCHRGLAAAHREAGDLDAAREHADAAAECYADAGDDQDEALLRAERGRIARDAGDLDTARERLHASVAALEDADRAPGLADVRLDYGRVLCDVGKREAAREQFQSALAVYESRGDDAAAEEVRELLSSVETASHD